MSTARRKGGVFSTGFVIRFCLKAQMVTLPDNEVCGLTQMRSRSSCIGNTE